MSLKEDLKELSVLYKISLSKLEKKISDGAKVGPNIENILNSLTNLAIEDIKVIIIGQDPYFNEGQANGLAFSVNPGMEFPPTLKNIFKELQSDLGINIPNSGDLTPWKDQGVLLLNRVLSVELGQPRSHKDLLGWEFFTEKLIKILNQYLSNRVFILWGNDAKQLEKCIDNTKHLILKAAHPSPLSAKKGFFGCKHFSKANDYLKENGIMPINWNID